MKLVTYRAGGGPRVGVLLSDGVHDAGFDGNMVALIERWDELRGRVQEEAEAGPPLADVEVLAPLRPRSLRDFLTFEGHLKNAMGNLGRPIAAEWYTTPAYYKWLPDTVIGPEDEIPWPGYTQKLDHELELAIVIGRPGKDIPRERALEHVFGYTIWNDMSARDTQAEELPIGMGPAKAKDWDGSNVLGPCIVTADEIDPAGLRMTVRVNGRDIEPVRAHEPGGAMSCRLYQTETGGRSGVPPEALLRAAVRSLPRAAERPGEETIP